VRNACYSWLQKNRSPQATTSFDEEIHGVAGAAHDPEAILLRTEDVQLLRDAVDELPVACREMIVLRELEGLSYREIAEVTGLPAGTVMSRLARSRERLQQILVKRVPKEP
jgi:RNA polymerase sigma-70 factor (ECF subfamily)